MTNLVLPIQLLHLSPLHHNAAFREIYKYSLQIPHGNFLRNFLIVIAIQDYTPFPNLDLKD